MSVAAVFAKAPDDVYRLTRTSPIGPPVLAFVTVPAIEPASGVSVKSMPPCAGPTVTTIGVPDVTLQLGAQGSSS